MKRKGLKLLLMVFVVTFCMQLPFAFIINGTVIVTDNQQLTPQQIMIEHPELPIPDILSIAFSESVIRASGELDLRELNTDIEIIRFQIRIVDSQGSTIKQDFPTLTIGEINDWSIETLGTFEVTEQFAIQLFVFYYKDGQVIVKSQWANMVIGYGYTEFNVLSNTEDALTVELTLDMSGVDNYFVHVLRIMMYDPEHNLEYNIDYSPTPVAEDIYQLSLTWDNPTIGDIYTTYASANVQVNGIVKARTVNTRHIPKPSEINIGDLLAELLEMVENTPAESWASTKYNQHKTMQKKIGEVIDRFDEGDYQEAYNKLLHDIKPKLTGVKADENGEPYGNGEFKNAWVICPDLQAEFEELLNKLLTLLKDENIPPVAIISIMGQEAGDFYLVRINQRYIYDGFLSYDTDGDVVSWEWNFGDGTIKSGENVTHTYTTFGDKLLTLTIQDDDGATSQDTVRIEIY